MKVSQIETVNSHAIIGGGAARDFGMSDSAEFYTVLSSTLYRDKKRAVAREVICNAWDAHIMTNKTDIPVEISLTDDELTIRDFGPGIPDELIIPIYCIYGASTKVADSDQTGGFGLGSKAPFAYSDHFSVTSCHKGTKTVYAISRGGVETNGKPSCTPMVSVPTTETGITVTIPIRSLNDRVEFNEHIQNVILQGGIKAKLNGEIRRTLNYTEARRGGFMIVNLFDIGLREAKVYTLYGTVLYPVSSTDHKVSDAISRVANLLPNGMAAILIAPPNSVGVVPSREALSFTDNTIATIKTLADHFVAQITHHTSQATKILLSRVIESKPRYGLEYFEGNNYGLIDNYTKIDGSTPLGAAQIVVNFTFNGDYSDKQTAQIVGALAAKCYPNNRRSLRRAFLYGRKETAWRDEHDFFKKEMMRHSTRLFRRAGSNVGILDQFYIMHGNPHSLSATKLANLTNHDAPENILIVAQSRIEAKIFIEDRIKTNNTRRDRHRTFMCVSIPRGKPKLRAQMIAAAEKYGIETHEVTKAAPKKHKVVKPKGKFLNLKNFNYNNGFKCTLDLEEPKFYVRFESTIVNIRDNCWLSPLKNLLLSEFEDIAVVRGATQLSEIERTGAKDAVGELIKRLKKGAKTRDTQYASLMWRRDLISNKSSMPRYDIIDGARNIVHSCPLAFFEFVPVRISSKQKVIKQARLFEHLNLYLSYNDLPDDYPMKPSDLRAINTKALKTFRSDMMEMKEFKYRFKNINLINNYEVSRHSPENHETIAKIIRCLKRTGPMPKEAST